MRRCACGLVTWNGWSVHSMLLPYLEATPVYNAINFSFDPLVCNSRHVPEHRLPNHDPGIPLPVRSVVGEEARLHQQLLR